MKNLHTYHFHGFVSSLRLSSCLFVFFLFHIVPSCPAQENSGQGAFFLYGGAQYYVPTTDLLGKPLPGFRLGSGFELPAGPGRGFVSFESGLALTLGKTTTLSMMLPIALKGGYAAPLSKNFSLAPGFAFGALFSLENNGSFFPFIGPRLYGEYRFASDNNPFSLYFGGGVDFLNIGSRTSSFLPTVEVGLSIPIGKILGSITGTPVAAVVPPPSAPQTSESGTAQSPQPPAPASQPPAGANAQSGAGSQSGPGSAVAVAPPPSNANSENATTGTSGTTQPPAPPSQPPAGPNAQSETGSQSSPGSAVAVVPPPSNTSSENTTTGTSGTTQPPAPPSQPPAGANAQSGTGSQSAPNRQTDTAAGASSARQPAASSKMPQGNRQTVAFGEGRRGFRLDEFTTYFNADDSILLPPEMEKLDRLAELLKSYTGDRLVIIGHTTDAKTIAGQEEVSRERAQVVSNYLGTKGINRSRLEIYWVGARQPVASYDTAEGMAKNRRAEVVILLE